MKTKNEILENIKADKEIQKALKKLSYSTEEDFYNSAIRYIEAVRKNRIICSIASVSRSGMSRQIKFIEASHGEKRTNWLNFYILFKCLGYTEARGNRDYFTISGCGMDMIFHTNYTNIHRLGRLGFLTPEEVQNLAQNTPPVI